MSSAFCLPQGEPTWCGWAVSCFIQVRRFSGFREASKRSSRDRWAAAPVSLKPSSGAGAWGAAAAEAVRAKARIGTVKRREICNVD